jgi:membrane protease YdiL (CAAX protease family)
MDGEGVDDVEAVPSAATLPDRGTLRAELWIVLWLSIAASALRSLLSLIDSLTRGEALKDQTTTLVTTFIADRPWLDVLFQASRISLALVPVLLVVHLLRRSGEGPRAIGLDLTDWRRDLVRGGAIAAVVGGTGLVFYLVAFHLGLNVRIAAVTTQDSWWTIILLLASAAFNALLEEIIVLAYFIHRAEQLGAKPWQAVGGSALLRGAYHLYQGFGGFIGNVVMGVIFGALFRRWGRVMPFLVAHFLIDSVAFVGYDLLAGKVSWLP